MHRNTRGRNWFCPEWPVSGGRSFTTFSKDKEHAQRLSESCTNAVTPFPCRGPGRASCPQSTAEPRPTDRTRVPAHGAGGEPPALHSRERRLGSKMRAIVFLLVGALLLYLLPVKVVSSFLMMLGGIATLCPQRVN